ncbi:MAG TPA: DinB family protein [Saprospiraceae bacterium]|nr:DinB family protein [Saprospiraceae bacterium]
MITSVDLKFPRPVEGDCAPYFFNYINKVGNGDIVRILTEQKDSFATFIEKLTPEQLHYRYAPGKWSMAEMIGHILDTERVFAYRMMCISRGEQKSLPSFEQDDYVAGSIYDDLNGKELADEWKAVRASSIMLCLHMSEAMAAKQGMANNIPTKAYSYPYMLAGHLMHHLEIARDRYLQSA